MKQLYKSKREEGFTIIEVLIVLAIAGLIILIVFLAVPALQRNSRNTQRKNAVSSIGGALGEYVNNHNGQLPGDNAKFQSDVLTNTKSKYFDTVTYSSVAAADNQQSTDTNSVTVYKGTKCNSAGDAATLSGASSRSVAALYAVESGGGTQSQCQEL